ncbi:MAG: hypothetical protein LBK43_08870 [Treponema sp.]|jgi:hypothetical protein|nr:hypothetical protein [Treponema sp.]
MRKNHAHAVNVPKPKSVVKTIINPSIVAWLCIGIYTAAIGFSGFRLYSDIMKRRDVAEQEFFNLVDISTAEGAQGFMTELFKEKILDAVGTSKTLQGAILSAGSAGYYTFERFKGETVNWSGDVPQFKPQFGISKKPFNERVQIANMRNVDISAVYNTIDYSRILTILKYTLLVIAATFGIACLTLVLQFFPAHASYPPMVKSSSKSKPSAPYVPQASGESPIKDKPIDLQDPFLGPGPTGAPPPSAEEVQGLLGKHLGEESATRDRLASELHRCAFFEQDMVFMIMTLEAAHPDTLYPLITDEAVRFFILPDLIFEKTPWGVALILPDVNLDQGLAKSGEFHQQVLDKYPECTQAHASLYIGMTSRAGRFITAERLMLEANQALEKAREDASAPIVAFKSDPEKYRAFMASQNTKQP